ncbi:MAG: aminoacetone oxidase family FAD-binding enzyme, partial [Sulfurovum sp.]|nr:aminoacetone oxidase family FAD-binding enzyme [Sulfurovum sp.]
KMGTEYFLARHDFIMPALKRFSQKSLLIWLERQRLFPVIRKNSQYFCERSASQIVDVFTKELRKQRVILNEKVLEVTKRDEHFTVTTNKRSYTAKHVVVASGGLSFPKLGASGIGYEIAASFGHKIIKTAPALVGLTVQKEQFFFKALSGASCKVNIKVSDEVCTGDLLFTHKGLSGPAVLDASLYWEKGSIEIDFLPDFSWKACKGSKKQISSLLSLPKRITKAFLLQLGVRDKAFVALSKEDLDILQSLHHYTFAPAGTFGYSKAEVTKGGVCTDEVDAQTLMSNKVQGLYFLGEVLDVTGRLGGYNFQWAFSSAYSCAYSIKKRL